MKTLRTSLLLFSATIILQSVAYAQPKVVWDSAYGGTSRDWGHDFAITPDGGMIVASETTSGNGHVQMSTDPDGSGIHSVIPGLPAGNEDFWVTKLDAQGNVQWQNALGGVQAEVATSIEMTSDGGYVVAGFGGSTDGDFPNNEVDSSGIHSAGGLFWGDVWIVKLDANGNMQWHNAIGGSKSDMAQDVIQTSDGGYLMVGSTYSIDGDAAAATDVDGSGNHSATGSTPDLWVIKLNAAGQIQWHNVMGGTSFEYGGTAIETATGYMIASTSSSNNGDLARTDVDGVGPHGSYDFWMMHLDFNGQWQWHNVIGGSNRDIIYASPGIIKASDGNYVMVGRSISTNGDASPATDVDGSTQHGSEDYWVVKCSPTGQRIWHNHIGTPSWDEAESVANTCDGGLVVSGYSKHLAAAGDKTRANSNGAAYCPWIVKLDINGQINWETTVASAGPNYDGPSLSMTFGYTKDFVINTDQNGDYFLLTSSGNLPGADKGARNIGSDDVWLVKLELHTVADFTWDTACFGFPTQFTDSSFFTNPLPAHNYQWNFGDPASGAANTSGLQNPTHVFTAPGNFNVQLITTYECESDTVMYTVYVEPIPQVSLGMDTAICGAGSVTLNAGPGFSAYIWDDNSTNQTRTVSTGGTYWVRVTGVYCDNSDTINVTIEPIKTHGVAPIICQGQTLFAGGANQTTSGVYVDTLQAASGCDSILTTTLTVTPASVTSNSLSICTGGSALVHGQVVTSAGVYTDTVPAAGGCDSISSVTVNITPILSGSVNVSICTGQSYLVGGAAQTTSGAYVDTLQTATGCDSVLTTNLNVTPAILTNGNLQVCTGGSQLVHGNVVTQAGVYNDTLTSVGGCDSISSITVTVTPIIVGSKSVTICTGQTHFAQGANQTATGAYIDTLQTASGCDSVLTTNLTVTNVITSANTVTICTGSNTVVHGQTVSAAGTYVDTLTTSGGCDSVSTVTVAVNNILTGSVNVTICQGQTHFAQGANQTTSGAYIDTLQTSTGCDSVLTTNLLVNPIVLTQGNRAICSGTSTLVHGVSVSQPGVYTDTLTSATGCDSISTVNVSVTAIVYDSAQVAVCSGQSLMIHGSLQTSAGVYADTNVSAGGCDSISVVTLVVNTVHAVNQDFTLCEGDTVQINGVQYHSAQNFSLTYASSTGCDSTVTYTVELIERPTVDLGVDILSCEGTTVELIGPEVPEGFTLTWWDGWHTPTRQVTEPGTYTVTISDPLCFNVQDEIVVEFEDCNFYIYVPNAFTPNNDPYNGTFKAKYHGELESFEMRIHDRWGQLVFLTEDPTEGWDGMYKDEKAPTDVYVYRINYKTPTEVWKSKMGKVTLMR